MTHCPNCQVELLEATNRCPICQKHLTAETDAVAQSFYPVYHPLKVHTIQRFTFKLTLFIAIAIVTLMIALQVLMGTVYFGANLIGALAIYGFILVNYTIMSRVNTGYKIVVQVAAIAVLLVYIDAANGAYWWSTIAVIPAAIIGAVIAILVIVNVQKMQWNTYIHYLISLLFLALMPVPLIILGIVPWLWLALAASLFAILTLIGVSLLSNKSLKSEFIRRFHF
ncbi:DUF6320 domain-containing protein [Culicoidibacter larvae]|uniref:Zinc ribbon domain-containing protein n=1 Tax=Culicoidibacter larvae TaxID=2579976 RepID=A0A5R8QDK3_9FIRM|nr:DUF6320 domain-containing protein [Culicoidibacter larvae]TLG75278.1 hypothetical protein FEZ08_04320 [Culicoidibacter larvae]